MHFHWLEWSLVNSFGVHFYILHLFLFPILCLTPLFIYFEKMIHIYFDLLLTYGAWPIRKLHVQKIEWWICGKTRKDSIRNSTFGEHLGVTSIGDKLRENPLRWFGQRGPTKARKSFFVKVDSPSRKRGRLKSTWIKVVRISMKKWNLSADLA